MFEQEQRQINISSGDQLQQRWAANQYFIGMMSLPSGSVLGMVTGVDDESVCVSKHSIFILHIIIF
jgi:hypothetical protein